MKRLQFRHNNEVFKSRELVVKYFADMVDSTNTASTVFKSSLYAEPLVAKYLDEDGNTQVIFAIGVDGGLTPYHIIDSKEISELILANKTAIELESERANAAETSLNEAIIAEVNRASAAELSLSGSIDTEREERLAEVKKEREERIAAINEEREERLAADELESNARRDSDDYLQAQITKNISTIVPVTENLSANVREEYVLKNADGEEMGSHIKIYKDSALVGAEVNYKGATSVTQKADGSFEFTYDADMDKTVEYLYLIYRNESGSLNLVGLDFENFLMENEEGLGIKIVDHKITVKIKGGERYLTVTEDGVQTINISEDIEAASKELNDELIAKLNEEITRSTSVDEETKTTINEFSASTISEFNKLSEEVHATIDSVSAETVNTINEVSATTTTNIERLDNLIVAESDRAQESEGVLKSSIEAEVERAEGVEAELTDAIKDEATLRENRDNELSDEIISDRVNSKDIVVNKTDEGTSLTIQTDEVTITKLASAATIYDTNVAVLGTLLRVKKVEPTASNVKSRYELQGANGQLIGDPIEMPIESALVGVKQGKVGDVIDPSNGNYITFGSGDTTMNFVYRLEDGSYELAQVIVSEYFTDSHFGRGLNNQDGVVSLLEGDGNEFLVIGEDTIAVVGVNEAIRNAKDAVETKVNENHANVTALINESVTNLTSLINEKHDTALSKIDEKHSESTALTETRYSEATSLTETRHSESISHTNTQIALVTENINSSVETLNASLTTAINNINDNVNSQVATIDSTIKAEALSRESADAELRALINTNAIDITSLKAEDATINGRINTVELSVEALDAKVKSDIEKTVSDLINADSAILSQANTYTDAAKESAKSEAINAINEKRVIDIKYNSGEKKIFLMFADGILSDGFDASEFVVDGMLDSVTFNNERNEINFSWNTIAGKTDVVVPLNKFVDQYNVADDSKIYLSISDDNKISAIVDKNNGFSKTLSTTEYVETFGQTIKQEAIEAADKNTNDSIALLRSNVDVVIAEINTNASNTNARIDALSGSLESNVVKHNTDIESLRSELKTYVDNADSSLSSTIESNKTLFNEAITQSVNALNIKIEGNKADIDTLNGGKDTQGSIVNKVDYEIRNRMIVNGPTITNVTIEDARTTSLIKEIAVNDEFRYYVSNDAKDMVYVKENGERVNLGSYILSLESKVALLEQKIADNEANLETIIKNVVKDYIVGTTKEISASEKDGKFTIGFDENAIFGEE